ncbi:hypothetical protein GRS96_12325 [Rathayibacter sp. VKM Ac-2803]|uniref:hypothetical protein n=1 Tax=Rathayibacter sp. VKM Ac-2803 TaxID=2609256 RepID=UPI001357E748|nr:hypothetical protein [Rathayibacter sp. VKM Ac-2803]MWV50055.1 hypothetical protein [Rathayibacter sp. VKM Ac-2803]
MPHNPFARWRITGTWAAHASYSLGGEDYPLPYGTLLPAPASGSLFTSGRPRPFPEFQCGQVGSAGRRSVLMLDVPIRDVVAVVLQHQSAFGAAKHYAEGETCGFSGASAKGHDRGGDVHLHIHCLTATGQRRRFTDYFPAAATTQPTRPAAPAAPIEEDDMFTDEDRALLRTMKQDHDNIGDRLNTLEDNLRALLRNVIDIIAREGRGPGVARVYEDVERGEVSIGVFGQFWYTLGAGVDAQLTIALFAADGFVQNWADRKAYPTLRYNFARMLCGSPRTYDAAQIAELARQIDEIGDEELERIDAEAKAGDQPVLVPTAV